MVSHHNPSLYFSCCWVRAQAHRMGSICTGSDGCGTDWDCHHPGMAPSLCPLQAPMSSLLPPQEPGAGPARPASAKTKLCFFTYFIAVREEWALAVSGSCGLSGLCLWSGARDSWFLVLALPFAQCVALEDSLSSAARQIFLLLDGEVTPALLKGQATAGINSSVLLVMTSSSEGRH